MPRIRTVKPRLFKSASLARCSRDARLLFIGLLTEADDEGRLLDSPKMLAGALFPYDDDATAKRVAGWLDELVAEGCVLRYSVRGTPYLALNFGEHQKISHPTPSILPSPSESDSGVAPEPFRPEVEQGTGNREGEQGNPKAGSRPAASPNGKSRHLADVLNVGLVTALFEHHPQWESQVTWAGLQGLVRDYGPPATNHAIDELYANAADVDQPYPYLRRVAAEFAGGRT